MRIRKNVTITHVTPHARKVHAALGIVLSLGGMFALARPHASLDATHGARSSQKLASVAQAARSQHGLGEHLEQLFTYRMKAGKAYEYAMEQTTKVLRSDAPYADVSGKGTLQAHVVAASDERIELIVRIAYDGTATTSGALAERTGGGQRTPLAAHGTAYLRIDASGRIEQLSFPPGQEKEAKPQTLSAVIAAWLYTLPSFAGTHAVDEHGNVSQGPFYAKSSDVVGEFSSEYLVDGGFDNPLSVTMHKLGYTQASALTRIKSSQHHLKWSLLEGYLLHADSEDHFTKGASDLHIATTETSRVDFTGTSDSEFTRADVARYSQLSAMYVPPKPARRTAAGISEGRVAAWDELQNELHALPDDPNSDKPLELFGTLARSLEQHPEMLPKVLEETRLQKSSSTQFKMLVGAIGALGTPEAQAGLIDVYSGTDADGKSLVLESQTLMETQATPETKKMLLDAYDHPAAPELQNPAGLALGNTLRNGNSQGEATGDARARIRRMWTEATTMNEKEYALSVIGNSGDPSFLDLLLPEIEDPESLYRGQAIAALRFMNDDRSAAVLFQVLALEDQPELQNAALGALFYHGYGPDFFEPLSQCFVNAKSTDIRIQCARVILQQPQEQQRMHTLLEAVRKQGKLDDALAKFIEEQLAG